MTNTKIFNEIIGLLQADLAPDKTYEMVCTFAKQSVPYESVSLFMYDKETKKMNSVHQSGEVIVDLLDQFNFGSGTGMSGWVAEQKDIVIIPSLAKSKAGKDGRFQSFVSMPLIIGERLIGVMNLGHSKPEIFKKEDNSFFSTLASQISLVLEQIELRKQLALKNKELINVQVELKSVQEQFAEKGQSPTINKILLKINHEINSPLESIMSLTEILSMSIHTLSTEKISNSLKMIKKESLRIKKITQNISNLQ